MTATRVVLEISTKRVFASALDWPGWCRQGKTEEAALEALAAVASRYASIAAVAGHSLPAGAGESLEVEERVKGNATTEFGAPGIPAESERKPLTKSGEARQRDLVDACWAALDAAARKAPAELRKGPRGGGRDRDQVVEHVLGAEASYVRKLGIKPKQPEADDKKAVAAFRDEIRGALAEASTGRRETAWPGPYMARRVAWHAVDHAWEIEDRA